MPAGESQSISPTSGLILKISGLISQTAENKGHPSKTFNYEFLRFFLATDQYTLRVATTQQPRSGPLGKSKWRSMYHTNRTSPR